MLLMALSSLIQLIVVLIVCVPLNGFPESDFIVGAGIVVPGELPYQVSVQFHGRHHHLCGGSILNNCWILTAAHCVDQIPIQSLSILAGTTKLDYGGVRVLAEKVIWHESFKRPNNAYDIAVVKLKQCLTYSEDIKPVALETNNVGSGIIGIVSGWGYTDQSGIRATNSLKKFQVRTITNRQCSRTFKNVVQGNICAVNAVPEQETCQGDPGGPLVELKSKKQIGLVSANTRCAENHPELYTRISTFIPWIQKNIQ